MRTIASERIVFNPMNVTCVRESADKMFCFVFAGVLEYQAVEGTLEEVTTAIFGSRTAKRLLGDTPTEQMLDMANEVTGE